MEVTTLSNGLRVVNFSSPHTFTFTDGTIVPACSDDWARALMLNAEERSHKESINNVSVDMIDISFNMSSIVLQAIIDMSVELEKGTMDIVLCPLPVLTAIRKQADAENNNLSRVAYLDRFVGIRIADRITKTCHIDKFCRW